LYEHLKSILVDDLQLKADRIRPEATLEETGLDSLGVVELSLVLGKRYGVEISDDELLETATIAGVADLLARRASARLTTTSG
jgi:acyl carrier protein